MEITECRDSSNLEPVKKIITEYVSTLDVDIAYQGFEEEFSHLEQFYFPPDGCFLLAEEQGVVAGCVGFHKIEEGVCEMKRFYVKPEFRNRGAGKALVGRLISIAKERNYHTMKLGVLSYSDAAIHLYQSFGFTPTPLYFDSPLGDKEFAMMLALNGKKKIFPDKTRGQGEGETGRK